MKTNNLKQVVVAGLALIVSVSLTACGGKGAGSNPTIDGVVGPNVEFVNGRLILSMTIENLQIDGGLTIPIKKYPNSSVQIGPDFQSSGTLIMLTVSASDFLGNGSQGLDPQALPGGRPLPSVAAGALPAVAFQVPQLANMTFYVGPQVIGFFVPLNHLGMQGTILTFRFYNTDGEAIGILGLVGKDTNGQNAGLLAMMRADLLGILPKPSGSTLRALDAMY